MTKIGQLKDSVCKLLDTLRNTGLDLHSCLLMQRNARNGGEFQGSF